MLTEEEILKHIKELESERSEFVTLVEKRLASFDGGIFELRRVLGIEVKPQIQTQSPMGVPPNDQ